MKKRIILSILIFCILMAIIVNPSVYIKTSLNAVTIWATILVPSLFPFFVFTKILTKLGTVEHISSVFSPISVNIYKNAKISSYIFFMSILTGYPVGSKLVADLYSSGKLTKTQAVRCLTFCSNSGPMFIVGSVGVAMLLDKRVGYIMLISHILGALINGLIYRNKTVKEDKSFTPNLNNKSEENILSSSVNDSIFSILLVGGMVIVAFIILQILENINAFSPLVNLLNFLGVDKQLSSSIISGIFEITKGCLGISNLSISISSKAIICSTLISFGGISTLLQSMAFIKNITSYKFMLLQKTTHAICACAVSILLSLIFL